MRGESGGCERDERTIFLVKNIGRCGWDTLTNENLLILTYWFLTVTFQVETRNHIKGDLRAKVAQEICRNLPEGQGVKNFTHGNMGMVGHQGIQLEIKGKHGPN